MGHKFHSNTHLCTHSTFSLLTHTTLDSLVHLICDAHYRLTKALTLAHLLMLHTLTLHSLFAHIYMRTQGPIYRYIKSVKTPTCK